MKCQAAGRNQFTVLVQSLKHEGLHTQQQPLRSTVKPPTEIQQGCDIAGAKISLKFNLHQSKRKGRSTAELPACGCLLQILFPSARVSLLPEFTPLYAF